MSEVAGEQARDELVDRLLDEYGYDKESVLGDEGLLSDLSKRVLERALNAELTEHLGYDKNDPAGDGSGKLAQRHDPEDGAHRGRLGRAGRAPRPGQRLPSRRSSPRASPGWRGCRRG